MQANGQNLPVACGGSRVRYGMSGFPNSVFNWEVQGGSVFNNYNDSVDIIWDSDPGIKVIKVTEHTAYNCMGAPSYGYVMVSVPKVSISQFQNVCLGQSIVIDPLTDFTTYHWNTGETTKTITTSVAGLYKLKVTDADGCTATDSVYLAVNRLPNVYLGRDTTLCSGQKLTLDAGTDGDKYNWSTGEITQTIQVGEGNQAIWVAVENSKGCSKSDTLNILACRVADIPNAFTPNGDGDNDTWRIRHIEDRSNITVEIFDRWGRRVFQSKNGLPAGGWDGTFNGRNLPMDSYYYIINMNDGSTPLVGNVTIIR